MNLPAQSKLVSIAEMQELERRADAGGHSYASMMERAGKTVADTLLAMIVQRPPRPATVLVLVGPGNNGGDGLVCARYLRQAGINVYVYLWQRRTHPKDDYQLHFAKVVGLGVETHHADQDPDCQQLRIWLGKADIVVDALLGTGTNRAIVGQLADILTATQVPPKAERLIVAVDCPSGLDCDTGELDPLTLTADVTVTFAHAKYGHYLFPGAEACGRLVVADIGIPAQLSTQLRTFVLSPDVVRQWLPARPRHSHKGAFGKLLAAVGCVNYPGAAALSCAAAGRVGAGLVTGAIARPLWSVLAAQLPEPTWLPLPEEEGCLSGSAAAPLQEALPRYTAFLLGCGLGNTPSTRAFVAALLSASFPKNLATLIDADGLNCLAQLADWPTRLPSNAVLTPHVAEMARLCDLTIPDVIANRWRLAREKAVAWQAILQLKGPYTVIADPTGWLAVLPVATPALAMAGSGDVLAGVIAGLLAQGVAPFQAACVGAWLHGQAGLRCEKEIGRAGVLASDLIARLPLMINETLGNDSN